MPFISPAVAEHPSGYVMFWLFASLLILFVVNNRKKYYRLGSYYYSLQGLFALIKKSTVVTDQDCYYCRGEKAMAFSYKIELFRIRNVKLKSYGALYGRSSGIDRHMKTVHVPRSRKAFTVHTLCTMVKIFCIFLGMSLIHEGPWASLGLPAGMIFGSLLTCFISLIFRTKLKVSYLFSPGMIIKILIWFICIYFLGAHAVILLFIDPIIEATMRYFSKDRLFIPLFGQYPVLDKLFDKGYQLYLELPVWSVINPFFRWLF